MTLREALAAIVAPMPDGSSVTLPVEWLRRELAVDDEEPTEEPVVDLTVLAFAALLDRKPSTVRGWLIAGEIPEAYKFHDREWRIPRAAARRYLDGQRDAGNGDAQPVQERPGGHRRGAWRKDYRRGGE